MIQKNEKSQRFSSEMILGDSPEKISILFSLALTLIFFILDFGEKIENF